MRYVYLIAYTGLPNFKDNQWTVGNAEVRLDIPLTQWSQITELQNALAIKNQLREVVITHFQLFRTEGA